MQLAETAKTKGKSPFPKVKFFLSCLTGMIVGILTLSLEMLSSTSDNRILGILQHTLFVLVVPGILGSMAISGNTHAWYLWTAAGLNGLLYFVGSWLVYSLVARVSRTRI